MWGAHSLRALAVGRRITPLYPWYTWVEHDIHLRPLIVPGNRSFPSQLMYELRIETAAAIEKRERYIANGTESISHHPTKTEEIVLTMFLQERMGVEHAHCDVIRPRLKVELGKIGS